MDNVGLVRYMKAKNVKMDSLSAINQDYAWRQDTKNDFTGSMEKLLPNAKVGEDQLRQRRVAEVAVVLGGEQVGLPWRLALSLVDDGWILRADCIWHKPNAMPSSTKWIT